MDLKQKYREETNLEPYGNINQKDNYTRHYVKWLEKQCNLYGVSGSTFIAICQETKKAYIFDGSEMYLWEDDETVDIYEVKYYR